MQKRLLNMLVIGGVAMLCFAPRFLEAEDDSAISQISPKARVFTNVNDVESRIPVDATALPETQNQRASLPKPDQMQYRSLIETISSNNGVDPDLIDAMMKTESNYDRWAISSKGAKGLMQLIPETGRRFGVQDFFDPRQNIEGGVRYMKFLLNMFHGDIDLSLAAYNAGENLVARIGKIPPITETRNYVRKIRAAYAKSSSKTFASSPNLGASQPGSQVIPHAGDSRASTKFPNDAQAVQNAPISTWVDQRGSVHFSNLEPLN